MNTNETAGVKPALPPPPLLNEEQFSIACEVIGKLHDYATAALGEDQHVSFFQYVGDVRAVVYVNGSGDVLEAKTLAGLVAEVVKYASKDNEEKAQRIAALKAELAELEATA